MTGKKNKIEPQIRPSQVTRTFGPGSIYDNEQDSMVVMGLDYWRPESFKIISDPILLMSLAENFPNVHDLVSTSSYNDPENPGNIPIRSFPRWGFCPVCKKLVDGRNGRTWKGMICDSVECAREAEKENGKEKPHTFPVRFVTACKNGHLDEFPWYNWVHRKGKGEKECSPAEAQMYIRDDTKSLSLTAKSVECTNCNRSEKLTSALSEDGLMSAGIFGCTKERPWLKTRDSKCVDKNTGEPVQMRGIFKGASNMYFPIVRSAVTIPPFSDELSEFVTTKNDEVETAIKNAKGNEELLQYGLNIAAQPWGIKNNDGTGEGRWTVKQVLDKREKIIDFQNRENRDIYKIEFEQLNSGEDFDDVEFSTKNIDVTESRVKFAKYLDKLVLIRKCRVVSAITGFTRIEANESGTAGFASLASENYDWLPVVENRGEGIFISFNNDMINSWYKGNERLVERMNAISTYQGQPALQKKKDAHHTPKYVFLHTLSHAIMKNLGRQAGYTTASITERIYCDDEMAGIFIFTASPSSDGALGGLTEIGRQNPDGTSNIWSLLEGAVDFSTDCSCDPLCSMQEPEKTQQQTGAACHACMLLPETCCEKMNFLLDRYMVSHTLHSQRDGFLKDI